jgi:hypothetical protein
MRTSAQTPGWMAVTSRTSPHEVVAAVFGCWCDRRTVFLALQHDAWISDITGARTVAVTMQYLDVCRRVENINLNPGEVDLVWRRSSSGLYSTSSAYVAMFHDQALVLGAKEVWKV